MCCGDVLLVLGLRPLFPSSTQLGVDFGKHEASMAPFPEATLLTSMHLHLHLLTQKLIIIIIIISPGCFLLEILRAKC